MEKEHFEIQDSRLLSADVPQIPIDILSILLNLGIQDYPKLKFRQESFPIST